MKNMAPACVICSTKLLDRMRVHVFVNGRRIVGVFLCHPHGRDGRNMLTAETLACLRCGMSLSGQVPVPIMVNSKYVPGSLCLDHGANGHDHMTAEAYIKLVTAAVTTV